MNKPNTTTTERLPLKLGSRIRLIRDVERYSDFLVKAGAIGVCTCANERGKISVRMDEYIEGAQHWQNEIWWEDSQHGDFDGDAEVLPVVRLVRVRCAGDNSYLSSVGADVGGHAVGDVFTFDKSNALILTETAQAIANEYRNYLPLKGEGKPIYYIEPCGVDAPARSPIIDKPVRIYLADRFGSGFWMQNETLWSAPSCTDGTLDMANALPVNEWESEPLNAAGYAEICGALNVPVPPLVFTLKWWDERKQEWNERTPYATSTVGSAQLTLSEAADSALSKNYCPERRAMLYALVVRAMGEVFTKLASGEDSTVTHSFIEDAPKSGFNVALNLRRR